MLGPSILFGTSTSSYSRNLYYPFKLSDNLKDREQQIFSVMEKCSEMSGCPTIIKHSIKGI